MLEPTIEVEVVEPSVETPVDPQLLENLESFISSKKTKKLIGKVQSIQDSLFEVQVLSDGHILHKLALKKGETNKPTKKSKNSEGEKETQSSEVASPEHLKFTTLS